MEREWAGLLRKRQNEHAMRGAHWLVVELWLRRQSINTSCHLSILWKRPNPPESHKYPSVLLLPQIAKSNPTEKSTESEKKKLQPKFDATSFTTAERRQKRTLNNWRDLGRNILWHRTDWKLSQDVSHGYLPASCSVIHSRCHLPIRPELLQKTVSTKNFNHCSQSHADFSFSG